MNAGTGQTPIVLALVFLTLQTVAAQRPTNPSTEVLDVADPPVQAQPGQEQEPQNAADLALIERRMQAAYERRLPECGRLLHAQAQRDNHHRDFMEVVQQIN